MYKITVEKITQLQNEGGTYSREDSKEIYKQIVDEIDLVKIIDSVNMKK